MVAVLRGSSNSNGDVDNAVRVLVLLVDCLSFLCLLLRMRLLNEIFRIFIS